MNETRRKILNFIRAFEAEFGRIPIAAEIAEGMSMRHETVVDNLHMLQRLGYVQLHRVSKPVLQIVKYRLPGEAMVQ